MQPTKAEVLALLRACRRLAIDAEMVTEDSSFHWLEQHRKAGRLLQQQCATMITFVEQRGLFDA